jgi:hypothetical protein
MARPLSCLPKPRSLYLVISLLFAILITACTSSLSTPDPTAIFSPIELPTSTAPAAPALPVQESTAPAALTPTAMVTGEAQPCPPVGDPAPLPEGLFDSLPERVLAFLNGGGSLEALSEALYMTGVANLPEPTAAGDMDGDGWEELVVSVFDPDSSSLPPSGMLLIYTCRDGAYLLAYQEDTRPSEGAPGIRFLRDLNADGQAELVSSSATCGAHTCFERVQVIQWDGTGFRNHLEGDTADLPYPTVYLSPTDQEGLFDLQVSGSGFGSVGAGPQRNVTRIWSFNEGLQLWQISDFYQEPSNYRIHILHDAAAAAERGDYQQALMLYNRVLSDTTLEDWADPEQEQAWIKAFARYQMVAIYTLQDREAFANTVLEELKTAAPPGSQQVVYSDMAVAYIDGYQDGGAVEGCRIVQDYAALHPGLLDPLGPQSFGYGNPPFTEEDLCP